ncbi:hypothetical protein GCM10011611_08630 [Aliidongia dinghuensis]|uniref:Uncharacterized protein n=1 Tax=Aliidongia dinghuensis TaxID=1867774 RepID=A0A8J2YPP6_9PROT|nr:hypothetical protein [Aliidongia dinghuensis]GGF05405.1 hypothetical protein GCM10011611_08630 [Aliidongia dinghuensis]
MTQVSPTSSNSNQDAINEMTEAFNQAIKESAKITAITTTKKVELDAASQRPQQG